MYEHGPAKFPDAGLLQSSEGRGWSCVAAELRSHSGARAAGRAKEAGGALLGARLKRVLDYIHDNHENELLVAELAAVACLSRFHFARAFREAMGVPPHRYVSAQRLERARLLLSTTDRSLIDISMACGFSSQANFTRAFRRATGRTPGEVRRFSADR